MSSAATARVCTTVRRPRSRKRARRLGAGCRGSSSPPSEHTGQGLDVLTDDLAAAHDNGEAAAGGAPFDEDEPVARDGVADPADLRVAAGDGGCRGARRQLSQPLDRARADEKGEVARRGAIGEEAPGTSIERDLDGAVGVVPVGPAMAVRT